MSKDILPDDKRFKKIMTDVMDPGGNSQDPMSQILGVLKKAQDLEAIKLSFSEDPQKAEQYAAVYKRRISSIPPAILKRTRDTEELVGGVIFPLRAKQISLYGHPRPNRFDIGMAINPQPHLYEEMKEEEIDKIKKEIVPKLRELLLNCGSNENVKDKDKCTFAQYLHMITEDMLLYGWFSTEVRSNDIGKFHSFRATDAGTIYFATDLKSQQKQLETIRQQAKTILERLNQNPGAKNIDINKFTQGEYTWVQVIDDLPYQVFTDEQMIVWSLNPSTDIMRAGYPVSPIERILSSIVTHINLTTHNKMFFLNGRAARNVMIFQSENLDADDIQAIRAQMTAHINSANAAWRMPVFGIGQNDKITIQPLDAAGRDMEFQYLADLNKRMIMAAFQMSPDEVAALSYLSKGTNSQSLAESNNEWKMIKGQESGLRPILQSIEAFLNERLLPRINPEWAKLVRISLEGLDADSPEKEATRLQQDSAIYLSMNDIMDRVEKEHVPIGGEFPLNAAYMATIEKYYTMGQILESFDPEKFKGASQRPEFAFYMNNPAWFQFIQIQQQAQQLAMQQQQMQLQAQAGGNPNMGGDGQTNPKLGGDQDAPTTPAHEGQQRGQPGQEEQPEQSDLDSAMGQIGEALSKAEKNLPINRKEMLKLHKAIRKKQADAFERDSKSMFEEIMNVLEGKKSSHGHEHGDE